jgi:hypothetical protein
VILRRLLAGLWRRLDHSIWIVLAGRRFGAKTPITGVGKAWISGGQGAAHYSEYGWIVATVDWTPRGARVRAGGQRFAPLQFRIWGETLAASVRGLRMSGQ